nr:sigma-70 family RNA polymerase sigma factor [Mucilaginibacter phyllosphaerae]
MTESAPDTRQLDPHNWVKHYADYLYLYTITRIKDEEQARDLVQETFLSALEGMERFAGKSSERTWLTAILKNKIIDTYRKRSSGLKIVDVNEPESTAPDFFEADNGHWKKEYAPVSFSMGSEEGLYNKEFNQILQKCMQKLPALWMAVFTMKHLDDATTNNICDELKITASNFWVIIHRAKLNLRACLQKNWI